MKKLTVLILALSLLLAALPARGDSYIAAVMPAEGEEAFLGRWVPAGIRTAGGFTPMDAFVEATPLSDYLLTVEPGKLSITSELGAVGSDTVFENGALTFCIDGQNGALYQLYSGIGMQVEGQDFMLCFVPEAEGGPEEETAPADPLPAEIVGSWVEDLDISGDVTMISILSGAGITLEIRENGSWTAALMVTGLGTLMRVSRSRGTCTRQDGQYTLVESSGDAFMAFTCEEGKLVCRGGDQKAIFFSREGETTLDKARPAPAPAASESEEAFLGTWQLYAIGIAGKILPQADYPDILLVRPGNILTVEPGRITLVSGENTVPMVSAFEDGALLTGLEGTQPDDTVPLRLTEDGSLAMYMGTGEYDNIWYFVPAE